MIKMWKIRSCSIFDEEGCRNLEQKSVFISSTSIFHTVQFFSSDKQEATYFHLFIHFSTWLSIVSTRLSMASSRNVVQTWKTCIRDKTQAFVSLWPILRYADVLWALITWKLVILTLRQAYNTKLSRCKCERATRCGLLEIIQNLRFAGLRSSFMKVMFGVSVILHDFCCRGSVTWDLFIQSGLNMMSLAAQV